MAATGGFRIIVVGVDLLVNVSILTPESSVYVVFALKFVPLSPTVTVSVAINAQQTKQIYQQNSRNMVINSRDTTYIRSALFMKENLYELLQYKHEQKN